MHTKENQPKDQTMKLATSKGQASQGNSGIDSELPNLYGCYD